MMEMRIEKVEADIDELKKDMSIVKTDIAVIKSNYVTKGDLHQEIAKIHVEMIKQTKWILGGILSTAGISLAIARWLF
ncbi:hypothetical protein [Candidatus Pantoea formicae]|nr:hypothetical protein [Pantoea formicae]MDF7651109.1 hypothetical protein [Erwiniaceae bacterium L1_54_3]